MVVVVEGDGASGRDVFYNISNYVKLWSCLTLRITGTLGVSDFLQRWVSYLLINVTVK